MMNNDTALIVEGGGMRGAYVTGVLDFLLENKIQFGACYGVSAGAGHACSFLSEQKGRAIRVSTEYLTDARYVGIRSLLKTGDFFESQFIYDTIPKKIDPYDYETFSKNPTKFFAVATSLETGKPEYFLIKDLLVDMPKVVASSSLPFLSKTVFIDNKPYLDGGVSDSIPFKKALQDGYKKTVIILTRDIHYRKKPFKFKKLLQWKYGKYPLFIKTMLERANNYNQTIEDIITKEKEGKIFVIRPSEELHVGRLERDKEKVKALHTLGFSDASRQKQALLNYLSND